MTTRVKLEEEVWKSIIRLQVNEWMNEWMSLELPRSLTWSLHGTDLILTVVHVKLEVGSQFCKALKEISHITYIRLGLIWMNFELLTCLDKKVIDLRTKRSSFTWKIDQGTFHTLGGILLSLSLSLSFDVLENVCALCEQRIMGKYQCPFFFFFVCQCCNVAEVVMIHEMNKANMATNKKLKETKRKKHPCILFATQLELSTKTCWFSRVFSFFFFPFFPPWNLATRKPEKQFFFCCHFQKDIRHSNKISHKKQHLSK